MMILDLVSKLPLLHRRVGDLLVNATSYKASVQYLTGMLADKDVALVGNSANLVKGAKHSIDSHDVVLRINKAWNLSPEQRLFAGIKTTAMLISTELDCLQMVHNYCDKIVWMTPELRYKAYRTGLPAAFYPQAWWHDLYSQLGARPSTGCMAVDMVSRLIGNGQLSLYGFDFFQAPSYYLKEKRIDSPHTGNEEEYIRAAMPESRMTIVGT